MVNLVEKFEVKENGQIWLYGTFTFDKDGNVEIDNSLLKMDGDCEVLEGDEGYLAIAINGKCCIYTVDGIGRVDNMIFDGGQKK